MGQSRTQTKKRDCGWRKQIKTNKKEMAVQLYNEKKPIDAVIHSADGGDTAGKRGGGKKPKGAHTPHKHTHAHRQSGAH
jgi:hypothetical protein